MEPILFENDLCIYKKYINDISRSDIIIYKYPFNHEETHVGRIIGLPGEEIRLKNNSVYIYNRKTPSGFRLDEPYLEPNKYIFTLFDYPYKLSSNEYFILKDNRIESYDSRAFGPLKKDLIVGKFLKKLNPLDTKIFNEIRYLLFSERKQEYVDQNPSCIGNVNEIEIGISEELFLKKIVLTSKSRCNEYCKGKIKKYEIEQGLISWPYHEFFFLEGSLAFIKYIIYIDNITNCEFLMNELIKKYGEPLEICHCKDWFSGCESINFKYFNISFNNPKAVLYYNDGYIIIDTPFLGSNNLVVYFIKFSNKIILASEMCKEYEKYLEKEAVTNKVKQFLK